MNQLKYSTTLQADYQNMKKVLYKNFLRGVRLLISTVSIFDLVRATQTDEYRIFIILVSGFIFRAVSLILISVIKKNQETYTVMFFIVSYSVSIMSNYWGQTKLFDSSLTSFYVGNGLGLGESLIMNQIPELSYRISFRTITTLVRFSVIPTHHPGLYVIQIALLGVAIYLDCLKEKYDKKLFGSYYYSKEQLDKFKHLVTHDIPDGIVVLSRDLKKCLFANNSFKSLFGEEDLIHHYSSKYFENFQSYEPTSQDNTAASSSNPPRTLLSSLVSFLRKEDFSVPDEKLSMNVIHTNSGTKSVFETKAFQLLWDEEPAVVVILHDITQQNTILELRLQANLQKDRILATVSHELRTPLNSILGIINIIQNSTTNDTKTLHYLKICENSCSLLQSLVNSILDMNLIRFNQIKLDVQKIDLHQFLKDITRLFEFQCAEKGIFLTEKMSSSISKYLVTDKARLSQILINLLGNALKFTMKGGITILARENIINHEKYLELSVQDTGIGIKEEDHEKLFKMFGKVEEHSNTIVNRHGIGLGLNISDSLSKLLCQNEQLAGIKVDSIYGKGSRFSFMINVDLEQQKPQENDTLNFYTLGESDEIDYVDIKMRNYLSCPIKNFQPYHKNNPAIHPVVSKRIPSILIVDDNPLNLFVAEKLVSCQGYKVKTALSGEIALDLFLQNNHSSDPIILILMDLQMPVMDGYMTTTALKDLMQQKKVPEVPIVALTANDTSKDKETCLQVGMIDMLSKPLRTEDLFRIINSHPKL